MTFGIPQELHILEMIYNLMLVLLITVEAIS